MGFIVQKASGVNGATFGSPTTAGNWIVLALSWLGGAAETYNSSHVVAGGNDFSVRTSYTFLNIGDGVNGSTRTQGAILERDNAASCTSISIVGFTAPTVYVWAYELQNIQAWGSFGPQTLMNEFTSANGTQPQETALFLQGGDNGNNFNDDSLDGFCHFYLTVISSTTGDITALSPHNWTIDSIRGSGFAAAYIDGALFASDNPPTGVSPTFTSSVSTYYSGGAVYWDSTFTSCQSPSLPRVTLMGNFEDLKSNPIANGYLEVSLNQSTSVSGQQIPASKQKVLLDNNGYIIQPFTVVPTDLMAGGIPSPPVYRVYVYSADGTKTWKSAHTMTVLSTNGGTQNINNCLNLSSD